MEPLKVYACYNTNRKVRLNSSSGAIFSVLAEYVLDQRGVIYGVAMSKDCYSAEFISVTEKEELPKLRGSKYMQAKVGDAFRNVKMDLLKGRYVLFTGTGCQVNGLKKFLNRDYEKLFCIDVICHGVPSPTLWKKYAKYQEMKNKGKLNKVNFRCKEAGWVNFGMKEYIFRKEQKKEKIKYISKDEDSYMQMFLKDYCLRPSCYECRAKEIKMSDITIADFWGIESVVPKMNDGMGTSLVLIRTEKGEAIFEFCNKNIKLVEVSYKDGIKDNPAEYRSCVRPVEREAFFKDMQNMNYEELEKKYTVQIKRTIKRKVKILIQRILWGGQDNSNYGLLFYFITNCEERLL